MTAKELGRMKAKETIARKIAERKPIPNATIILRGNFSGNKTVNKLDTVLRG